MAEKRNLWKRKRNEYDTNKHQIANHFCRSQIQIIWKYAKNIFAFFDAVAVAIVVVVVVDSLLFSLCFVLKVNYGMCLYKHKLKAFYN